jgi:putative ABC transport system permease protein
MINDYTLLAIRSLKKRKLRTFLTLLGIIIAIATIFILVSISVGLRGAVEEQFRQLGTDKFFIMPKGQIGSSGGGAVELTIDDVNLIKKVRGVREVNWYVTSSAKVEFKGETRYALVLGFDIESSYIFLETGSLTNVEGRSLKLGDEYDVEVGYNYRFGKFFSSPVKVGDTLLINDIPFKVRGVVEQTGSPPDDQQIYMSIEKAREIFNIPTRVEGMIIQIEEGEDINEVAALADRRLMQFRDLDEKTKDFIIMTPEELLGSFNSILNIITSFLIGVAAISLLVGAIGIMNTMYTSVLERTKEIGTMKAVGAQNSDILKIFLIESGMLGAFGGIVGVIFGFGVAKTIEYIVISSLNTNLLQIAAPAWLFLSCIAFSFIIGAVSGIWPAWRASKLKTVDALRYE